MQYNFQEKIVKTKKIHSCHGCNEKIEIGTKVMKYSGIYDNSFFNTYYCDKCEKHNREECNKCRDCWENESCVEGYIAECKIEREY